jgi:hypothetical protein
LPSIVICYSSMLKPKGHPRSSSRMLCTIKLWIGSCGSHSNLHTIDANVYLCSFIVAQQFGDPIGAYIYIYIYIYIYLFIYLYSYSKYKIHVLGCKKTFILICLKYKESKRFQSRFYLPLWLQVWMPYVFCYQKEKKRKRTMTIAGQRK